MLRMTSESFYNQKILFLYLPYLPDIHNSVLKKKKPLIYNFFFPYYYKT